MKCKGEGGRGESGSGEKMKDLQSLRRCKGWELALRRPTLHKSSSCVSSIKQQRRGKGTRREERAGMTTGPHPWALEVRSRSQA